MLNVLSLCLRMSTRLMRLRQTHPGSNGMKGRDMEDTIQELEARVAVLETQKGALQNKLSLAKQHILDLGGRTPYKSNKGNTCVYVFPQKCTVKLTNLSLFVPFPVR